MSGSGLEAISLIQNQSNSTKLILRPRDNDVDYVQLAIIIPGSLQLVLCAFASLAIIRVRALRVGQNIYVVNMVLSDILRGILGVWIFAFGLSSYGYNSRAGSNACVPFFFFWHWQFFWSTWGTVLISRSRYRTIKDPLADGVTTRKAAFASTATCLMGIVIAVPPLFTWARYKMSTFVDPNGYYSHYCVVDQSNHTNYLSFLLFYYGISYWLPFVFVIYYLGQTLRIVFRSIAERRRLTGLASGASDTEANRSTPLFKSKALWYVIALVASNAIFPAPYIITQVLRSTIRISADIVIATGLVFRINFLVNSVLYCFWAKTLTSSLWNVVRCRKLRNVPVIRQK